LQELAYFGYVEVVVVIYDFALQKLDEALAFRIDVDAFGVFE
jgi:hypothetical protein